MTADKAILSLVEAQVFSPDIVRRTVRELAARLAATGTTATAERAALEAASRKLERQQAHVVDAIADGGESRALRAKLADVERQQAEVGDRLKRRTALVHLQGQDLAALEATAQRAVARDWAGLLARHALQARPIVKKFVAGRFVFKPVVGLGRPRYEVTATASTPLILGAVVPALLRRASGPTARSQVGGGPKGTLPTWLRPSDCTSNSSPPSRSRRGPSWVPFPSGRGACQCLSALSPSGGYLTLPDLSPARRAPPAPRAASLRLLADYAYAAAQAGPYSAGRPRCRRSPSPPPRAPYHLFVTRPRPRL